MSMNWVSEQTKGLGIDGSDYEKYTFGSYSITGRVSNPSEKKYTAMYHHPEMPFHNGGLISIVVSEATIEEAKAACEVHWGKVISQPKFDFPEDNGEFNVARIQMASERKAMDQIFSYVRGQSSKAFSDRRDEAASALRDVAQEIHGAIKKIEEKMLAFGVEAKRRDIEEKPSNA